MWAPAGIVSTVTRNSSAADAAKRTTTWGKTSYTGSAAPAALHRSLSGIVALMKMLDPSITYDQVRSILVNTANWSGDPKVSTGYVDAYQAVAAVKANNPPMVKITQPAKTTTGYQNVLFSAEVKDPESPSPSPQLGVRRLFLQAGFLLRH